MTKVELLRRMRGWTQEELAAKSGVSDFTIWRAEDGKELRPETVEKIARGLGVEVNEISDNRRSCKKAS